MLQRLFIKRVLAVSGGLALAGVLTLTAGFALGQGAGAFDRERNVVRADQGDPDEDLNAEADLDLILSYYTLSDDTCFLNHCASYGDEIRIPKTVSLNGKTYKVELKRMTGEDAKPLFEEKSKVSFEDGFLLPEDCSRLFENCRVKEIDLSNVDFSRVKDMSYMFDGSLIKELDLRGKDLRHVTNMKKCFYKSALEKITLSGLNLSNVTDMTSMCDGCHSLLLFDAKGMKAPSCKTLVNAFYDCWKLEKADFAGCDFSSVANIDGMFYCNYALKELDFSSVVWNKNVVSWDANVPVFIGCRKLTKIDLHGFLAKVDIEDWFRDTNNLQYLDISGIELTGDSAEDEGCISSGLGKLHTLKTPYGNKCNLDLGGLYVTDSGVFCTRILANTTKSITLGSWKITEQPKSVKSTNDVEVVFKVKTNASDSTIKYQWQVSKNGGSSWEKIMNYGANTSTLTLPVGVAKHGAQYRCVVSYDYSGKTVTLTSEPATLTLYSPMVSIHDQPVSQTAYLGEKVLFAVKAGGSLLKYQWQYSSDGKTWKNSAAAGATSESITVTAGKSNSGLKYRCVVISGKNSATSSVATLTVKLPITKQPASKTVYFGDKVQFSTGTSVSGVTYQWQYSSDGKTWKNSAATGAKTSSITVSSAKSNNGVKYRCMLSYGTIKTYTSVATLTGKAIISRQPASVSATNGSKVKFTVVAGGTNLSYQWQYSGDGKTWRDSSATGAKTASITVAAGKSNNGVKYRCIVKNGSASQTSSVATLTVKS